ncbi:MAG TPA: invasin domain 3-containing protein [Solirubrobacteraceae bacterium]|nr:invasin domain 3-containing protein [Solirubrobacteraceae bacterium]
MARLAELTGGMGRIARALMLACLCGVIAAPSALASNETFVNETFAGATTASPNWIVPSTPTGTNAVCLTAGTAGGTPVPGCPSATDSPGSGALRFTTPTKTEEGGLVYGLSIPTTDGFDATFQSYQYGPWGSGYNRGADGISFFFAAANPADPEGPASIGQPGGELGYSGSSSQPGLSYGYLGIGLDVYGNYANTAFEGTGCTDPAWDSAKVFPDNVSVRGPGSGTVGYCMLNSTEATGGLPSGTTLDGGTAGTRSSSRVPVEVVFNPSSSTVYTTSGLTVPAGEYEVAFTPIGGTQQILSGPLPNLTTSNPGIPASWINPATGIPYQVTFGWTGSTGGDIEYHEVNNVSVATVSGTPPALTVGVSDNAYGYPTQGSTMNYDVNVANQLGSDSDPGPIDVTDNVPAGETPSSTGLGTNGWTCSIAGQKVSCSYPGPLAGGAALPQLVVPVTVDANPGTSLTNTVIASSDDSDPGSGQETVTVEPAPVNVTPPSLYGTPQDGQTLSAGEGAWSYSPSSYSYQWYDCPAAGAGTTVPTASCSLIPGAGGATYTLTPADVGQAVEVAVTATNPDGTSGPVLSPATAVVTPGPAAAVTVTLSQPAITADGSSETVAKALVTDDWGVPVPGDTVDFSSSGAQSVGSTTDNGDGTYQAVITSTTATGAATITAVDESMSRQPSGGATLTQTPGPAAQVALSLSPATITADGTSSSTATATVTDAYGNPVADPAGDVVFSAGDVGGAAAPSVTATSAGAQPGTYLATVTSTEQAGTSLIAATDSLTGASNQESLTQAPGPATFVSVSLAHPSITANGSSQTQATVTVRDQYGNPVSGDDVTLGSDGGQSIGPVTPGSDPGTYLATITSSTTAGTSTITASDGSTSEQPSGEVTLTQVAGPAAQLALSLSPSSLVADGHSSSVATATVTDAYGNPVSGDPVTITSDGGQSVSPVSPGHDPGTYLATITSTAAAGTSTITATDASATPAVASAASLTQVDGPGDHVAVALAPGSITANGTSGTLVTATVTDANGNPVSGDDVVFTSSGGQKIGPVSAGSAPGTYTALVTSTTQAGAATITAADTSVAGSPSGQTSLTQKPGAPAQMVVSLAPSSVLADGVSTTLATIKVTDKYGNPVSGDPVKLTTTGGQEIGPVTPTGAPGTYSAMVTATNMPGTSTITASDGPLSQEVTLIQQDPQTSADQRLPTIQIDTPADGGVYLLHQHIRAAYSCTDPLGVTDILSCAGPTAVGQLIDTRELGTHAFAVTAVNRAGEIVRVKAHYMVVSALPPPPHPIVFLAGALRLSQGSVFVPIGCRSPTDRCRGGVTLRMTLISKSPSGQVSYGFVKVGFHRYSLLAFHKRVVRVRLTQLGLQTYAPGLPLPTIILAVKELGGAPRSIVVN